MILGMRLYSIKHGVVGRASVGAESAVKGFTSEEGGEAGFTSERVWKGLSCCWTFLSEK